MLTYQLHTRVFRIEEGSKFNFPNKGVIELKLGPPTAFGTDDSPSRTVIKDRAATVTINANTGRCLAKAEPPLEPLDVTVESSSSRFTLKGDMLSYEFQCSGIEELESAVAALKWFFPSLLALTFSDPPTVLYVRGSVGQTTFRWEHIPEEWRVELRTVTPEILERSVIDSYEKLLLFSEIKNRRLAAALHYFHIGLRLNVCGDSPWEFMAETILNYCKSLAILFGNSNDNIRDGLSKLGFNKAEIEGDFIPLLILRNYVDVAHPRVAIFKRRDLKVLYSFLSQSENTIRELLLRVIAKVAEGSFEISQDEELSLNAKERKDMDRLVTSMESRIKYSVD